MRIAQIIPSYTPARQTENKAIYSHAAWLTNGLVERGHEVHLFGSSESDTKAILHSLDFTKGLTETRPEPKRYEQWGLLSKCYEMAREGAFDIIHSHFNVMTGFFSKLVDTPTLTSIHSPIEGWMRPILSEHKTDKFISFSLAQRQQMTELNWYANIYHGVDTDLFAFNETPEDYFLFLGRITEEKGLHLAIEAAKQAGVKLRIAGSSYPTESYWHDKIEQHINGTSMRLFGQVDFNEKIPLLQKAKALLFPTQYHEVFGYVMIEAMSCGTPVIAFGNGSVPEIVKDGKTGFVVSDTEGMTKAIQKIDTIDRKAVRARVERFFSKDKMVNNYQSVYQRVLDEIEFKKEKKAGGTL